jgi:hypothetical protein
MSSLRLSNILLILVLMAMQCTPVLSADAPLVPPGSITATASSTFYPPLTSPQFTCDGSGLTGDLHHASPSGDDMWLSQAGGGGNIGNNPAGVAGPAWLLYTFSAPQELERALIWNHNQANLTDRGLRNVAIHYRDRAGAWHHFTDVALSRAPGTPDYAPGNEIDLNDIRASAVLLTALPTQGNYGSDYFGLSEIRFHGTTLPCFPDDEGLRLVSIEIEEEYTQAFSPRAQGWLGSDVSYGIALDEHRILWLYGDTFLGTSSDGKRNGGALFINNSIAIQDISSGQPGEIQFYWKSGGSSFFPHQSGTPGSFYWPTMGIMLDGELFIFCFSMSTGADINVAGTTLLRILNPEAPPPQWQVNASNFNIGGNNLTIHTGLRREGDIVYFLGSHRRAGVGDVMILGRMNVADLLAGADGSQMEFHNATSSTWVSNPANATVLFSPGVTESSLYYDESLGYYLALTYEILTGVIRLSWARDITGPWHAPVCLYVVPEHAAVSFPIGSYAARIQPDLSENGRLLISYATNSMGTIAPLFTEEGFGIYHPRFISVQLAPIQMSAMTVY